MLEVRNRYTQELIQTRLPISSCRFRIATYLLLAPVLHALAALRGPAASTATLTSSAAGQATSAAPSPDKRTAAPDKRTAALEALEQVDALLQQAGQITGLSVQHPVKSGIVTKEQIQSYIQQRLKEDSTSQQLGAQEVALKEFGLLPAHFELQAFLVKLLTEQATAYYDHQRKQFYIADWTPMPVLRPAMIHELTHALQDQQVGLEQFLRQDGLNQDEQMARVAVVEGSGMLAMTQYLLSRRDPEELKAMVTSLDAKQFAVFQEAPPYLRESLLFPYTAGAQYMRWLVEKKGKAAYTAALDNPPRSTAEVLHPGRTMPPAEDLQPPDDFPLPAGYKLLDSNVLGELEVRVLLKQYIDEETAHRLAPTWRGFRYAVYENQARSDAFLVHRSRWQDAASAAAFADAYRKVLAAKGENNAAGQLEGNTLTIHEGLAVAQ